MNELISEIQNEIKKVIIGKDEVIQKVMIAILAKGHILMEDVPGVGKTTMAKSFSKVLGLENKRVQFTSDTMPSDIIGFSVYEKESGSLKYKPGAVMTNLLLADEINRTSSKTQSALLEAMEERHVTVDGATHQLPEPFIVIATQNEAGSAGTQLLPPSELDRFIIRTSMGYPDGKSQIEIMKDRHHQDPLEKIKAVTDSKKLKELIGEAQNVFVADSVYEYASDLVEATRDNQYIRLGISPRGALALCRAAKAKAFIEGRDYVIPNDVSYVAKDVFSHRILLDPKARLHEISAESVIDEILENVKKPDVAEFSLK